MKQKNPSIDSRAATKQKDFVRALEGVGDILVFETKRKNKNIIVLDGLKKIEALIERLFDIKKENPERFERLILTQEVLSIQQGNPEEAKLRMALKPDKSFVTFFAAIDQLIRIHDASLEANNTEISRFAAYHLNFILALSDVSEIRTGVDFS